MGPQHANRLQDLLEQVFQGNQIVATEPIEIIEDITKPRRDSEVTAWVNVIYGCNERCTYCVVPNVRGIEQSRRPEAIREEIEELSRLGYKEITLLGQNIDAYGRDLPGSSPGGRNLYNFTDLLYFIHDVPGIERIRFATSHPRYFTKRLIQACAELPKVCEHFHIPFQSGDNQLLKAMSRGYTQEKYRQIIHTIREYMPDASISADAIVGFPGETEEQFENTMKLVDDIGFDLLNTAAYSPRPGTPAALWENQLSEEVKADRLQQLNRLVSVKAAERSQRYLGRIEEVLVEGTNSKDPSQVMGRTRGNRLTFFLGNLAELKGQQVKVKITQVRPFSLTGETYRVVYTCMTAKNDLRLVILSLGLGLVLTGMGVRAIACQNSPNSPTPQAEGTVDYYWELPEVPLSSGEIEKNPAQLPQIQGNGDYQRSPHSSWETTQSNPQGIDCRMLGNTNYSQLENPSNKTELNIENWPVVGKLPPGQDFEINLGPAGFGVVYDTKQQPWIYVEKTSQTGTPSHCFVRANQQFVRPISDN